MKKIVIDGPDQILYQWDRGQRLLLHGYEDGTRVDFSRCNDNKAASKFAYSEDGAVFCDIPDALLMEPNHLHGYVYEIDGDRGETVREFMLPVIRRPKPEGYVEPEEVLIWHELEGRIDRAEKDIEELKKRPAGGGLNIDSDGKGNVTIKATGSASISSDGAGNVRITTGGKNERKA